MPRARFAAALALGLVVTGTVAAALLRGDDASALACGMEPVAFWREPGVHAALVAAGAREARLDAGLPLRAPDLEAAWGGFALRDVARLDGRMETFTLRAGPEGPEAHVVVPEGAPPALARARLADALEGLTPAERAEREAAAQALRPWGTTETPTGRFTTLRATLRLPLDATPFYEALSMRSAQLVDQQPGYRMLMWDGPEGAALLFQLPMRGADVPLDAAAARLEADAGDRVALHAGARGVTVRLDGSAPPAAEDLAREALARVGVREARLEEWHAVTGDWECRR